jgi:hypothetical protein
MPGHLGKRNGLETEFLLFSLMHPLILVYNESLHKIGSCPWFSSVSKQSRRSMKQKYGLFACIRGITIYATKIVERSDLVALFILMELKDSRICVLIPNSMTSK